MRNPFRTLVACTTLLTAACAAPESQGPAEGPGNDPAAVSFLAVAPSYIETLALTITGPGIDIPIVLNLVIDPVTHVASGTISVPAGSDRRIVANAFNAQGINTHRGETTVTLVPGNNPPLSLTMAPLLGDVAIEIHFGSVVLVLTPTAASATVGQTIEFTFAATSGQGVVTTDADWGIANPAVAAYLGSGRVQAIAPGVTTVTVSTPFGSVQSTLTVTPPLTGTILYERDTGNNPQLYRMLPDGSGSARLSTGLPNDIHGTWGPMATMVAFSDWPVGNVFTMNADGTNRVQLTTWAGADYSPQISPAGTRIVWVREQGGGASSREIYTMNTDGSDVVRLTNNAAAESWPRWSPDGTRIFFDSERDGDAEIYVMNADGSNPVRLTNTAGQDSRPIPSPDGTRLLFTSTRDGNSEVYVMNADGTNVLRVTTDAGDDTAAGWSPGGAHVLFTSTRTGNSDVFVAPLAGGAPVNLTNSPAGEIASDWR